MFNTRSVLVATAVGVVLAGVLIVFIGASMTVAAGIGLASAAIAATLPWAMRDGRFPGPRSAVRARRVINAGYAIVAGSALVGLNGLNVDRTTRFSLVLLVLAVGWAGLMLGSAAAILDSEGGAGSSGPEPRGI